MYNRDTDEYRLRNSTRQTELRKKKREYVEKYKQDKTCADCGNDDPRVFEFDHIYPGKYKHVSTLCNQGYGLKQLAKEIELCEIVCANCHRIRTYDRKKIVRDLRIG